MLPFLLPLLGATIGAIANKKHRFKGALQGGAAGLGLGGLLKKPQINGIAGPIEMGGIGGGLSRNSMFGNYALDQLRKDPGMSVPTIPGSQSGGLKSYLKKAAALAPLAIGAFGAANSPQPEPQLPPLSFTPQLSPIASLNQYQGRPFAPQVQSYNQGGYYS